MEQRRLGTTPFAITPIGYGAFKIGRNVGAKYPGSYELPDNEAADQLLDGVLDLGINYIDTAPAYGLSEARIGRFLANRKSEFVLSTKVGEIFENGQSSYDFSESAVRASIDRSRRALRVDTLDIVFVHSDGRDEYIMRQTDVVPTLQSLKEEGVVTAIGFSGKTVGGADAAMLWADALMVEYNLNDRSHESIIQEAHEHGIGIVVKKGLGSGTLNPREAVRFVLANQHVTSLVVGGLDLEHLREDIEAADRVVVAAK